jgi:hypothetical protein
MPARNHGYSGARNRSALNLVALTIALASVLLLVQYHFHAPARPKPHTSTERPPVVISPTNHSDEWISASYLTPPLERLEATERLIRRDGKIPAWRLNQARALFDLGYSDEASEIFSEYLKIVPWDSQARIWKDQADHLR